VIGCTKLSLENAASLDREAINWERSETRRRRIRKALPAQRTCEHLASVPEEPVRFLIGHVRTRRSDLGELVGLAVAQLRILSGLLRVDEEIVPPVAGAHGC